MDAMAGLEPGLTSSFTNQMVICDWHINTNWKLDSNPLDYEIDHFFELWCKNTGTWKKWFTDKNHHATRSANWIEKKRKI